MKWHQIDCMLGMHIWKTKGADNHERITYYSPTSASISASSAMIKSATPTVRLYTVPRYPPKTAQHTQHKHIVRHGFVVCSEHIFRMRKNICLPQHAGKSHLREYHPHQCISPPWQPAICRFKHWISSEQKIFVWHLHLYSE